MYDEETDFTDARKLRQNAEKRLKLNNEKSEATTEEYDSARLLHELQVHQIELEMQNEELQQAYSKAEAALRKYTMLYDFAPMGYFTLDSEGNICDLNFTGAELLADKRFSLKNSNFKLFITEDTLNHFNNFFSKLYTNRTKESCEFKIGNDTKRSIVVYAEGIVTDDDQKCLLSVINISELKS